MKISQKQAGLLAREVLKKLQKIKVGRMPELMQQQVRQFVDKRRELVSAKAEAQEAINRHDMQLKKIVGDVKNLYESDPAAKIIEKVEQQNIPTLSQIEDEIILKAMFADSGDLEKFIESIADGFAKKLNKKVFQN